MQRVKGIFSPSNVLPAPCNNESLSNHFTTQTSMLDPGAEVLLKNLVFY